MANPTGPYIAPLPQHGFVYIASPYSHPEPLTREERYLRASYYLMQCLRARKWAYSPIVHCHELAKIWDLPKDAKFWEEYNFAMLRKARCMEVLRIDGWEQSLGVADEMKFANAYDIPIVFV